MEIPRSSNRDGLWIAMAVWLVVAAIWMTWSPFMARWHAGLDVRFSGPDSPLDVLSNLLLLLPFALIVAYGVEGRRHGFVLSLATTALLATVLEAGQWFIEGRVVTAFDPMLNLVGAAVIMHLLFSRHGLRHAKRQVVLGLPVAMMVVTALYLIWTASRVPEILLLRDLDPDFRITAGEDLGGSFQYRGRVSDAQVCGGEAAERICLAPGADAAATARLVAVAEQSQRIELSAWVRSIAEGQASPARIVSFGSGGDARNVTIGHEYDEILVAFRSTRTGPNGDRLEFYLPDAIHASDHTWVFARVARGVIDLRATDTVGSRFATYHFGLLEAWLLGPLPSMTNRLEPSALGWGRLIAALLLFWPIGMLAAWIVPSRATGLLLAALVSPLLLVSIERELLAGEASLRYFLASVAALLGALAITVTRSAERRFGPNA